MKIAPKLAYGFIFLFGVGLHLVQAQPTMYPIQQHPRLLLLGGEEEAIRRKLNGDATYIFLHKIILKECDDLLREPEVKRTMIGKRLLRIATDFTRRIFYLAYAARITGDDRYVRRAEEELLAVASFPDWNPAHFLDVAEMTMGVAIGYDWLYTRLSDSTRAILEDAIVEKGLEPSLLEQYSTWVKASHNWNQVCNASMAFGAIALLDRKPELARRILDRSIRSIKLPMDEYLPDGGYPEGYGYWSYGTTHNVLLISALEKAFGNDFGLGSHPGFLKTGYYLMHMTGSSGIPFNYSDCVPTPLLNPAMFWFASRLKDPSLLVCEMKLIEKGKNLHRIRQLPALMIWARDIDLMKIPHPASSQWSGRGKTPVALLRSGWDNASALYVGLKGGSPFVTHAHMDIGSFVFDALGERWAVDLGYQDYHSLESRGLKIWNGSQDSDRWKVFRLSNFSHNTLTINKGLQRVDGYAPVISTTSNPAFRSAILDLSSVYSDATVSAKRGVAIVDERYVAIRDEVELKSAGVIRWNMLTPAAVNIIDDKTAILMQKGKKVLLRIAEPLDAVLTTWSSLGPSDFDAPNPGMVLIGFETQKPAGEVIPLTVLLVPESEGPQNKMTIPVLKEWSSIHALE